MNGFISNMCPHVRAPWAQIVNNTQTYLLKFNFYLEELGWQGLNSRRLDYRICDTMSATN